MVLYLASDLLWASKIKGTADALGVPARPVRNAEMLAARLAEATPQAPVRALVVDLEAGAAAFDLIKQVRAAAPGARVVAFGPHVAVEALRAAHEAGAHEVMPRGAFASGLPEILTRLNMPG